MKLYYAQGTCSLAPHIALREANLPFGLVRLDMKTQQLEDGRPIAEVNEKGYVPVLQLDTGETLTEVSVILQWIADEAPHTGLAPPHRTMDRYRVNEWLNFIGSFTKSSGPCFTRALKSRTRAHWRSCVLDSDGWKRSWALSRS